MISAMVSFIFHRVARWRRRQESIFFGQTGLFLIAVDAGMLGDALRWEHPQRRTVPHLYGELDLGAVTVSGHHAVDGYHDIPELTP